MELLLPPVPAPTVRINPYYLDPRMRKRHLRTNSVASLLPTAVALLFEAFCIMASSSY